MSQAARFKCARCAEFTERGARVENGSLDDAAFVARATQGVDALFWLTPQNFEAGEEVRAGYERYGPGRGCRRCRGPGSVY